MNTFWGIFFYMIVGGGIACVIQNSYKDDCGEFMGVSEHILFTVAWPSIPVMALVLNGEEHEPLDDGRPGYCVAN